MARLSPSCGRDHAGARVGGPGRRGVADIEEMKKQCLSLLPKNFIRGDYKELVKLVLFDLGDSSQDRVQFLHQVNKVRSIWNHLGLSYV